MGIAVAAAVQAANQGFDIFLRNQSDALDMSVKAAVIDADYAITLKERRNELGASRIDNNSGHDKMMSATACQCRANILVEGARGSMRQTGKTFSVSEARETNEVCRALLEDNEWTPRVEQALRALSPKLQTNILARILKRQSNPSLAWKVFQWSESLPGFEHDGSTFYALIEVLSKAEDLQAVWTLINDLHVANIKLKPIPFTFLISSYGRSGKIKEAELTLHSMREFNCKPNVYTYNAVLFALFKGRNTPRAMFTYQKMLAYGCQPDNVTFNTLISGLCSENYTEAAASYLDEMLKMGLLPDMRTFNTVMNNYLMSGQLQKALNVYETALQTGYVPGTITYSMLLSFLFKRGMYEAALNLFKEMVNNQHNLDVVALTTVLHGLLKCNKSKMAFYLFETIANKGFANEVTYNVVLDWLCKRRQVDRAIELMHKMKETGVSPNTSSYNSLVMGAFKMGRAAMGLGFVSEMIEDGCNPDFITYTLLIDFFLKEGEIGHALTLFKEVNEHAFQPDVPIHNRLVFGLIRGITAKVALSVEKDTSQCSCLQSTITYEILKDLLCEQRQPSEALKFMAEFTVLGFDATSLCRS